MECRRAPVGVRGLERCRGLFGECFGFGVWCSWSYSRFCPFTEANDCFLVWCHTVKGAGGSTVEGAEGCPVRGRRRDDGGMVCEFG